jgi:spore cortex formation protein SpoVR/YcgB (stage V sporulation)
MRGQSIRDVAGRLEAEVSERHGDKAFVDAVLMAAFVQDEDGFAYDGERLFEYSRGGKA